jgi:hypothetical protein
MQRNTHNSTISLDFVGHLDLMTGAIQLVSACEATGRAHRRLVVTLHAVY